MANDKTILVEVLQGTQVHGRRLKLYQRLRCCS